MVGSFDRAYSIEFLFASTKEVSQEVATFSESCLAYHGLGTYYRSSAHSFMNLQVCLCSANRFAKMAQNHENHYRNVEEELSDYHYRRTQTLDGLDDD
jgi:hypothetical protein